MYKLPLQEGNQDKTDVKKEPIKEPGIKAKGIIHSIPGTVPGMDFIGQLA